MLLPARHLWSMGSPHLSLVLLEDGMAEFWHKQRDGVVRDSKRECHVMITGVTGQEAERDSKLETWAAFYKKKLGLTTEYERLLTTI